MKKRFWGYSSKEEALKFWPEEILNTGLKTTEVINVVDDATKWPQTSSQQKVITRIELANHVINYYTT